MKYIKLFEEFAEDSETIIKLKNGGVKKSYQDGTYAYYNKAGKLHRDDGPAKLDVIGTAGTNASYYKNGKLHRDDGPAIELHNGYKEWWYNGKKQKVEPITSYTAQRNTKNNSSFKPNDLKKLFKNAKGIESMSTDMESPDGFKQVTASYSFVVNSNEITMNIYDDKYFVFFSDATPIPTSLHTSRESREMTAFLNEIPMPLSKLNKHVVGEILDWVK